MLALCIFAATINHMKTEDDQQPIARRRGRPTLPPEQQTVPITVRLTRPQREKLDRLGGEAGGAQWIRDRIDEAEDPAAKG